jgi:sugar fermentation stimulation protein A
MRFAQALETGRLLRRYKRFLADLETVDGEVLTVHCPNTGAMLGCSDPGSEVWYSDSGNPSRKYRHTLEVVLTPRGSVGVNTALANALVREAIEGGSLLPFQGMELEAAETAIPDEAGRFDFLLREAGGRPCYVEVKNMTLCHESGRGSFPDAVSDRAVKHVRALERRVLAGDRAMLVFCAQHTGISRATLADEVHPEYGDAVRGALASGVEVLALGCRIERVGISVEGTLPFDAADQRASEEALRNAESVST